MTAFVLIHGAYQGGWIWAPVAAQLHAQGHVAHAPSLDGCGERATHIRPGITTESQAEEIAQLLFHEDLNDVVLVGTSSGGMVVARTAELARERVARLVFVDALVLKPGETIG
ncbi:MAG: alpha/beta hydrolase, partial [Chloroflexi bacterium]|nr:alpha/beta hydrolase [Chloroflexota bacterium]